MPADSCPVRQAGRTAVITLPDEIDVTNAGHVRDALMQALAGGAAVLAADMTGTRFCACQGVRALLEAGQAAASAGTALRVAASEPMVRQVLELTGADRLLDTYPSLQAALAAQPGCTANGTTADSAAGLAEVSSRPGPAQLAGRRNHR